MKIWQRIHSVVASALFLIPLAASGQVVAPSIAPSGPAALAPPKYKVSLVTVNPGPVVFEAFGHTMFIVVDENRPRQLLLFEYGQVNAMPLFLGGNPIAGFTQLFDSKIRTRASRRISAPDAQGIPQYLRRRYLKGTEGRVVRINSLRLTEAQAKKLVGLLDADVAAGEFDYDYVNSNCATRPRDRLFDDGVLGKDLRGEFEKDVEKGTLQRMVLDSIDEAVSIHGGVGLVPRQVEEVKQVKTTLTMLETMMGMPPRYNSAEEFEKGVKAAEQKLAELRAAPGIALLAPGLDKLHEAFRRYFFRKELNETPVSSYRAMFTPKLLKESLESAINPATGEDLIDKAEEIVAQSAP